MPYAFAVTKNLSIKLVVVTGLLKVTNKKTTSIFEAIICVCFDKFTDLTAYVDAFTTAPFFVGMWLMAQRKIENWIIWIVADFISVPLYFYKGLTFSSLQFILFTIIAILGYIEWKRFLQKQI
jgi:nicotinamide mononucleotide transporter